MTGDPFPSFSAPGNSNPNYVLDTAAGRYLLVLVLSRADEAAAREATDRLMRLRSRFDDVKLSFFGLAPDTESWRGRSTDSLPGVRWLFDRGAIAPTLSDCEEPFAIVVDPGLRVLDAAHLMDFDRLAQVIERLPPADAHAGIEQGAPVLLVPRVFESRFCESLIQHFASIGGCDSGFMREADGLTRVVMDHGHKRRSDLIIDDPVLVDQLRARLARRLVPEILKSFQFNATHIERYLVAAYDGDARGHFRPHRDNTTKGTAHRRFAVSLNLNDDYDGGELRFPEFGSRTYRPPVGGAVVFSCSLLHEATAVRRGRRYAFLPFLYDAAAAAIRLANRQYLDLQSPPS